MIQEQIHKPSKIWMEGFDKDEVIKELTMEMEIILRKVLSDQVQDKWLSVDEARNIWKPAISRNTLIKWSKLYDFGAMRMGGKTMYKLSEIMKGSKLTKR